MAWPPTICFSQRTNSLPAAFNLSAFDFVLRRQMPSKCISPSPNARLLLFRLWSGGSWRDKLPGIILCQRLLKFALSIYSSYRLLVFRWKRFGTVGTVGFGTSVSRDWHWYTPSTGRGIKWHDVLAGSKLRRRIGDYIQRRCIEWRGMYSY